MTNRISSQSEARRQLFADVQRIFMRLPSSVAFVCWLECHDIRRNRARFRNLSSRRQDLGQLPDHRTRRHDAAFWKTGCAKRASMFSSRSRSAARPLRR